MHKQTMGEFQNIQSWNLEVGNGQKIKFWTDLWIGDDSLTMKFPNLFNYSINKAGSIVDFCSGTGWQIVFRGNLDDQEVGDFCHLLQQIESASIDQSKMDTMSWSISKDKTFSVKSCNSMIVKEPNHTDANWPWKMIWKSKAPVKLACFKWIAIWEACLTRDNLQRRLRVVQQMLLV